MRLKLSTELNTVVNTKFDKTIEVENFHVYFEQHSTQKMIILVIIKNFNTTEG